MLIRAGKLLSEINSPEDLKKLSVLQLPQVCQELRQFIIDNVSIYGGHFGASLGVVETTVALHYAFDTPEDKLVWDVGHQAYGHKILTGRRDVFHTNRLDGGISGFPRPSESVYDTFGVGHSSTSISAALGMASAARQSGKADRQHIAIIGDGAMTGGLAFEGMNHAGSTDTNLIILLNDNCMSIDPNVGALKDYLTDITTSHFYNKMKEEVWQMLGKLKKIRLGAQAQQIAAAVDSSIKSLLLKQSNLFEALNLRYFGPVDGHDVNHLVHVLEDLKKIPGPKLLHSITTKGKGFAPAEKDQTTWHAPGSFDKITGEIKKKIYSFPQPPKYQQVFGETIIELAEKNEKIVGITPAMPSGSSLNLMMEAMPTRAYDVGIAEQHAVTFSAGLASQGMLPFCNIYSTFMQRAYDQVIHDVCIQNLRVIFCLDRAGFVGEDGATHHGVYDLAYMRMLPNMTIAAPMNEEELRNLMYTAQLPDQKGAFTIRYPRGRGVMPNWKKPFRKIAIGSGRKLRKGEKIALLSVGHIGNLATEACKILEKEGISPAHYDMRFVKPLDHKILAEVSETFDQLLTIEDGCLMGGFGSAVLEWMSDKDVKIGVKRLGIPDKVFEHATQSALYAKAGYGVNDIVKAVRKLAQVATKKRKIAASEI